jgi:poly(hydroxyalkanoate) granule-associated protein
MAKKLKQLAEKSAPDANLLKSVRDSAQEIWQAGLGAFAKAQQEGTKMFETLVKEGEGLSRKTRNIAESKINEVSGNVSKAANTISTKAQAQATEAWDKLEQVFEDRVARALNRLGVPTQKDVQALSKRVEDLTASLNALTGAKPAVRKATARKPAARKAAPRKAAAKRAA